MDRFGTKSVYREKLYTHIIAIILLGVCIYKYNVMQNPYFTPDEVGYWAAGAWFYGIDWSPIFSHVAYYGWGYGLLLAPLFCISNTALRFQVAIIINIILLIISYYLLISITKILLKNYDYKKCALVAAVTIMYSYHIAYAHLSMCEVYLTFLFILSVRALVSVCKRATYLNIVLFALVIGLQISTHLRMLILPIVSIFVFGYMLFTKKIRFRHVVCFFGVMLLGIVVVYTIKDFYVSEQYTMKNIELQAGEIVHQGINDSIAVRLSVFKGFFSLDFWKKFSYSMLGKIFYLGCASFFTIIFGFKYIVKIIWQSIKEGIKERKTNNEWSGVWLYIALSFFSALALNTISLMYSSRYDHLFYGRYAENTVAIIIYIGVMQIVDNKVKIKEILLCLVFYLISAILLYSWIMNNDYVGVLPLECAGFAGLFQKGNGDFADLFTIYAILIVIAISTVLYYLLKKNANVGIVALGAMWTIIAYRGLELYIYPEIPRMDAVISTVENIDSRSEKVWTLIPDDTNAHITAYVDTIWLQFQLDDRTVYVLDEEHMNELDEDDILVVSKHLPNVQTISQKYEILFENAQMYIMKVRKTDECESAQSIIGVR